MFLDMPPHLPADAQALLRLIEQDRRGRGAAWPVLTLGGPIDAHLPGGGLARGALHEVACGGAETEHAAAAALFVAGALAGLAGPVLWALGRPRLFAPPFAPALAAAGLHPDRVIYAEAGPPEQVLMVMEEALRQPGLAGVVGEIEAALSLTASRRLHLAAQSSGVIGFAIRRSLRHDDPAHAAPSAAVTRWRITPLPSPPPLPHAPDVGLGPARWRLELRRCRGGMPAAWITEACDADGKLGFPGTLAAALADRPDPQARPRAAG
jgi:protein ImuA